MLFFFREIHRETSRGREVQRERGPEGERSRGREIQRERDPEISREIQRDPERSREIQRDSERSREIQRDPERSREIQRDPEREKERERERICISARKAFSFISVIIIICNTLCQIMTIHENNSANRCFWKNKQRNNLRIF